MISPPGRRVDYLGGNGGRAPRLSIDHDPALNADGNPAVTETAASPHAFDAATRLEADGEGVRRGATSDDYWNFTGPFGGTTAATLLRAVLEHGKRAGHPISLTVNYCAPIARGAFQIALREIRTNRSTQHWYAELSQPQAGVAGNATIVCAARRPTWAHQAAKMPAAPAPETLPVLPTQGMMAWLQRYQFRFALGAPVRPGSNPGPSAEPKSALTHMWVNDWPARPLDFLALAAMCDVSFARIFLVRAAMVPIGTVSMTVYFHADADEVAAQGTEPVLAVSDAKVFEKGYFDQTAEIWSRAGRLLASSQQIVYYRD